MMKKNDKGDEQTMRLNRRQFIKQAAIASAPQLDDVKAYIKHKIHNGENLIQYGYDVHSMNPVTQTITISREHGEKVIEKTTKWGIFTPLRVRLVECSELLGAIAMTDMRGTYMARVSVLALSNSFQ